MLDVAVGTARLVRGVALQVCDYGRDKGYGRDQYRYDPFERLVFLFLFGGSFFSGNLDLLGCCERWRGGLRQRRSRGRLIAYVGARLRIVGMGTIGRDLLSARQILLGVLWRGRRTSGYAGPSYHCQTASISATVTVTRSSR